MLKIQIQILLCTEANAVDDHYGSENVAYKYSISLNSKWSKRICMQVHISLFAEGQTKEDPQVV